MGSQPQKRGSNQNWPEESYKLSDTRGISDFEGSAIPENQQDDKTHGTIDESFKIMELICSIQMKKVFEELHKSPQNKIQDLNFALEKCQELIWSLKTKLIFLDLENQQQENSEMKAKVCHHEIQVLKQNLKDRGAKRQDIYKQIEGQQKMLDEKKTIQQKQQNLKEERKKLEGEIENLDLQIKSQKEKKSSLHKKKYFVIVSENFIKSFEEIVKQSKPEINVIKFSEFTECVSKKADLISNYQMDKSSMIFWIEIPDDLSIGRRNIDTIEKMKKNLANTYQIYFQYVIRLNKDKEDQVDNQNSTIFFRSYENEHLEMDTKNQDKLIKLLEKLQMLYSKLG